MKSEEAKRRYFEITEIARRRKISSSELMIEIINAEIHMLEDQKLALRVDEISKGDENKKKEIMKVFEMMDCFEAQRKIYEKFHKNEKNKTNKENKEK